jgi:signal transduction histidine kinase
MLFFLNGPEQAESQTPVASPDSFDQYDSLVNHYKITDNPMSLRYAYSAFAQAKKSRSTEQLVVAYKLLGVANFQNKKDSSFWYYDRAAKIADSNGLTKLKTIILYNLAALHNYSNFYTRAITLLDSSIRLAELHEDFEGISNGYNMLGLIRINTHDYDNARKHFLSALEVAREHQLNEQTGVALSNLARSEFEQDPQKALAFLREAMGYLQKSRGTEEEMATVLINIGNRFTQPDSAMFYYKSALAVAEHANLSTITIGAYNNLAYSYLDLGDLKAAEACVRDHAIPLATASNDHGWLSSLYDTYADVCEAKGDLKMALAMQKKALRERVTDYRKKAADQVRLLSAQLDLQNKELTIQNEERKILRQQNQLQRTELILTIVALLAIIAVFSIFFLQHRNKVRTHQEKIESARKLIEMEESEKGRTARELHDLTGQLVLGISGMIENLDFPEPDLKTEINQRIKDLGASIRRISHRMNRAMIEHFTFNEMIEGLCKDYQKLVGLNISLHIPETLPEFPNDLVLHFYRILQELLTNAGKYARNSQITINIVQESHGISLLYEDNGPGFKESVNVSKGMGMSNVYERVKLMNGTVKVSSEPGKGIRWHFFFPVAHFSKIEIAN